MGLAGNHLIRIMIEQNRADPRRAFWSGVGGALDDPAVRAERGAVRRRKRLFPRLRARLARVIMR